MPQKNNFDFLTRTFLFVSLTDSKHHDIVKHRKRGENKMAETKGNENLMGAAAYLLGFVTGIILLLVEKQSKFVRFHAMQSTILFGGIFIVNIALGFIPIIGWLVGLILSFVAFILWIMCMWKAFQGEMYKVPYVGDIAEKQLAKMK